MANSTKLYEQTKHFVRYIHNYYSANRKNYAYVEHMKLYKPLIDEICFTFKPNANGLYRIFDAMLSFAERVQTEEYPDNEKTTRMTFRQICSFVAINVHRKLMECRD